MRHEPPGRIRERHLDVRVVSDRSLPVLLELSLSFLIATRTSDEQRCERFVGSISEPFMSRSQVNPPRAVPPAGAPSLRGQGRISSAPGK
jgi:hypothetical protein